MVNFYNEKWVQKIKETLKIDRDIPLDLFKGAIMRIIGTNHKNTEIWVRNYEDARIIEINKDKTNTGWVVNWLK